MAFAPSGNEAKKLSLVSHTKVTNMIKFTINTSETAKRVTLWPLLVNFEHIQDISTLFNIDMCHNYTD